MATFSTFLGLKLPATTDPFLLSDFISNWGIIDASPGVFICTSSSRPTWTSGQAGRLIYMTDYKQLSFWNGTTWNDLRDSAPVVAQGTILNTNMASNSSPQFTLMTFTTPRTSALTVWLSATYQCSNRVNQDLYQSILVDGTKYTLGGYREQIRFSGTSSDSGNTAGTNAMSVAIIPSIGAGTHTVGLQVDMGNRYSTVVTLYGAKTLAMLSTYTNNIL